MNAIFEVIIHAAKETPRQYFAPLIGAYKGIKKEYQDIESLRIQEHHHSQSAK